MAEQPNEQNNANENPQSETDWQAKFAAQQKVNRDLEAKLKTAYEKADKVDELEKTIADLQGKADEYAAAQKEKAVYEKAVADANSRILKAEVRAAAAGKLRDPGDALRFLDLSDVTVSDDGETDTAAITAKLDALLQQRPYLSAEPTPTGVQTVPPSAARDGDHPQSQLTRDDLRRMSPAEINKARAEGRLDKLMGR